MSNDEIDQKQPPPEDHIFWNIRKHNGLDQAGMIECARAGCKDCHVGNLGRYKRWKERRDYEEAAFETHGIKYEQTQHEIDDFKALEAYITSLAYSPLKLKRGRPALLHTQIKTITAGSMVVDYMNNHPDATLEVAFEEVGKRVHKSSDYTMKAYRLTVVKVDK